MDVFHPVVSGLVTFHCMVESSGILIRLEETMTLAWSMTTAGSPLEGRSSTMVPSTSIPCPLLYPFGQVHSKDEDSLTVSGVPDFRASVFPGACALN